MQQHTDKAWRQSPFYRWTTEMCNVTLFWNHFTIELIKLQHLNVKASFNLFDFRFSLTNCDVAMGRRPCIKRPVYQLCTYIMMHIVYMYACKTMGP